MRAGARRALTQVSAPVRLLTLLVLAVLLMLADLPALAGMTILLVLVFALECGQQAVVHWLRALQQLKWLFIALGVLYLGFTPGEPMFANLDRPSWQGVSEGGHRTLVLITLLLAVHWLVRPLPAEKLAAGFVWLATPLSALGLRTERFAVRLALTLQQVAELQTRVSELRIAARRGWVDVASSLVQEIESAAAPVERQWIEVATPRVLEWTLPVALGGVAVGMILL